MANQEMAWESRGCGTDGPIVTKGTMMVKIYIYLGLAVLSPVAHSGHDYLCKVHVVACDFISWFSLPSRYWCVMNPTAGRKPSSPSVSKNQAISARPSSDRKVPYR